LTFEGKPGETQKTTLFSVRTSVPLRIDSLGPATDGKPSTENWSIWFRDLPVSADTKLFKRSECGSPFTEGINDPGAVGRGFNQLNGYEWRLGGAFHDHLGPFRFYPVSLEEVSFGADDLPTRLVLTGRLQFPLSDSDVEQTDQSNVVQLTFENKAAVIKLPLRLLAVGS